MSSGIVVLSESVAQNVKSVYKLPIYVCKSSVRVRFTIFLHLNIDCSWVTSAEKSETLFFQLSYPPPQCQVALYLYSQPFHVTHLELWRPPTDTFTDLWPPPPHLLVLQIKVTTGPRHAEQLPPSTEAMGSCCHPDWGHWVGWAWEWRASWCHPWWPRSTSIHRASTRTC